MGRKRWIRTGLEWTALALLAVPVLPQFLPRKTATQTTANARTFTLTGIDGNPIPASAYHGKALLLNFWAPWCPPCLMEIPRLQKLQNEERGRLVVVGIVPNPSMYLYAATMMRERGVTYLLAQDSASVQKAFGNPPTLPTSLYISPSLHVVHKVIGVVPEYVMRRYAADAINQR